MPHQLNKDGLAPALLYAFLGVFRKLGSHQTFAEFIDILIVVFRVTVCVHMVSEIKGVSKRSKDFTHELVPKRRICLVLVIVLKTGLDWLVQPVQLGIGSQSGPVKTPKTGQQPVKIGKPGKNRG